MHCVFHGVSYTNIKVFRVSNIHVEVSAAFEHLVLLVRVCFVRVVA